MLCPFSFCPHSLERDPYPWGPLMTPRVCVLNTATEESIPPWTTNPCRNGGSWEKRLWERKLSLSGVVGLRALFLFCHGRGWFPREIKLGRVWQNPMSLDILNKTMPWSECYQSYHLRQTVRIGGIKSHCHLYEPPPDFSLQYLAAVTAPMISVLLYTRIDLPHAIPSTSDMTVSGFPCPGARLVTTFLGFVQLLCYRAAWGPSHWLPVFPLPHAWCHSHPFLRGDGQGWLAVG